MKRFILCGILLSGGSALMAQSSGPICGIYFDYDATGNRIKREHRCEVHPDPNGPVSDPGGNPNARMPAPQNSKGTESIAASVTVYPNPTAGAYVIRLSKSPEKPVRYVWYDERGQRMATGVLTGQETSGNIGSWPDGAYIVQVHVPWGIQTFRIAKLSDGK